jgi:hypothetical protein
MRLFLFFILSVFGLDDPEDVSIYNVIPEMHTDDGGLCNLRDEIGFSACLHWKNYGGKEVIKNNSRN